jgi:hypothetical protein
MRQNPFPNEHSGRIHSPKRYVRFRRHNDAFGKGRDAIYGITRSGRVEVQAVRFDAHRYSPAQAIQWLKRHYAKSWFTPAMRDNPSSRAQIYSDIIEIRAKKGEGSLYPGQFFKHKFKPGSEIIGNTDGSITVRSTRGTRLWKEFPQ